MQLILSKLNTLFRYSLLNKQLRASLVLTALSIAMLPENEARAKYIVVVKTNDQNQREKLMKHTFLYNYEI